LAIKIRLRRTGRKKQPSYRLVVTDVRSPRDGKFIEIVGHFKPLMNPPIVQVDMEKIKSWIQKGAKPTETVQNLLRDFEQKNNGTVKPESNPGPFTEQMVKE